MKGFAGVSGHSLVEVVVALLLLEVGVLGVASATLAADRISTRMLELEGAVTVASSVADSLFAYGYSGSGERATIWGMVRWGPSSDAPVEITVVPERYVSEVLAGTREPPLTVLLAAPNATGTGGAP